MKERMWSLGASRDATFLVGMLLMGHLCLTLMGPAVLVVSGRVVNDHVPSPLWFTALFYVRYSLMICQTALISIWLVFGNTPLAVRLLTSTAMIVLSVTFVCMSDYPHQRDWPPLAVWATVAEVFLVAIVLRGFKVGVVRPSVNGRAMSGRTAKLQFSIASILVVTLIMAISFRVLTSLGDDENRLNNVQGLLIGLSLAPHAFTSLWLALGRQPFVARLAGFVLAVVLIFVVLVWGIPIILTWAFLGSIYGPRLADWRFYLWGGFFSALTAIFCLLSLLVVRRCGYRLVWVRTSRDAPQADDRVANCTAGQASSGTHETEKKPPDARSDGWV